MPIVTGAWFLSPELIGGCLASALISSPYPSIYWLVSIGEAAIISRARVAKASFVHFPAKYLLIYFNQVLNCVCQRSSAATTPETYKRFTWYDPVFWQGWQTGKTTKTLTIGLVIRTLDWKCYCVRVIMQKKTFKLIFYFEREFVLHANIGHVIGASYLLGKM